jgi:hypothetical protein|tara:strand:+ start:572 stop:805 length:234 start_codon:yes stop_codon:yes gene_type:complete
MKWNDMTMNEPDPIVAIVMKRMADRSAEGIKKYGKTMMRTDVSTTQWIDHAIEELLDGAIYLERVKNDLKNSKLCEC